MAKNKNRQKFIEETTKKAEKLGMMGRGLINLDPKDLRHVLRGCNSAGVLKFNARNFKEKLDKKLTNTERINGALIHIGGNVNMSIKDASKIVEAVAMRLHRDARIVWSAEVSKMQKTPKVTVIVGTK